MDWETYIRWYILAMILWAITVVAASASFINYFVGNWWISLAGGAGILVVWFLWATRR